MRKSHGLSDSSDGFTIIEVVIVLAIASVILLMIFLVIPTLRRTQRNYQRREAVTRIAALLEEYKTNSKGMYPPDGTLTNTSDDFRCDFIQQYIDRTITTCTDHGSGINKCKYGQGTQYSVCYLTPGFDHAYTGNFDEINVVLSHSCADPGSSDAVKDPDFVANPSDPDTDTTFIAVWTRIEPSSFYCVDNGYRNNAAP